MKPFLPFSICLLSTILLSSCVYDPYASSYYDNSHGHYHGGYHNGFFSDYYIGIHKSYYRYRHTRCSHCSHYPCRGGHRTNYHTYYRDYRKPLHGGDRVRHDRGNDRHRDHRMGDNGKLDSRSMKESSRPSWGNSQLKLPFSGGNREIPPASSSRNRQDSSSSPRSFTSRKTPPKTYPSSQSSSPRMSSRSQPSRSRPERTSRPTPSSSPKTYPTTQKSSQKSDSSKKD